MDNCFCFLTHRNDEQMVRYINMIQSLVGGVMDFVVLFDEYESDVPSDIPIFTFNSRKLKDFFTKGDRHLPNNSVVLYEFSKENKYKHYFLMEDDVVFTGDWKALIENLNSQDLDFVYIKTDKEKEHYPIKYIKNYSFKKIFFCWCQFYYISYELLSLFGVFMEKNSTFHNEFLLPTLTCKEGLKTKSFESIGYSMEVTWGPAEEKEEKYRHRVSDTFYHPIKNLNLLDL